MIAPSLEAEVPEYGYSSCDLREVLANVLIIRLPHKNAHNPFVVPTYPYGTQFEKLLVESPLLKKWRGETTF